MRPKVLIIANEWTTILHFRMEILQGLMDADFHVMVALPVCDEALPIEEIGCELIHLNVARHGKNPFQDLSMVRDCIRIIKDKKPDIAITYTIKPNVYGGFACVLTGVPYLSNVTGMGTILQGESPVAKIMLMLMKTAFKKSRCVFFQNQGNYKHLYEHGVIQNQTSICYLPGSGVNLEKFSYEVYPEKQPVKFVIVSRIRHDKGYSEYFDAAECIKKQHPEVEFHVIGWYEDEDLRHRVDELNEKGIIIYHGALSQEEVHQKIANASCLVHPSYHEGMANVILEAASTGRPVIASNISGCKEAVEDEVTGYLCEVKSAESLIVAIERFLALKEDERSEMGKAGRRKMEREFDRQIVVEKLIGKIREII